MKRFILGVLMGVLLSFPLSVLAGIDFVGKAIEGTFPLYIDGQRASQDVIVVDGTSFLPVRAASGLFGYDVSFDNSTRAVLLNKQAETQIVTQEAQNTFQGGEEVTKTTLVPYTVKSNVIDVWNRYDGEKVTYFVRDNVTYVPLQIFNNYSEWDGEETVLNLPNGTTLTLNVNGDEQYTKGCLYFVELGKTFIDISELGYDIREDGDILWIE